MINRLIGFFGSQRQLVHRWELPLMGLLLAVGLTTNASTLETPESQRLEETTDSTALEIPFGFAPSWSENLSERVAILPEPTKTEKAPAKQLQEKDLEAIITQLEVPDTPKPEETVVSQELAPEIITTEELEDKQNSQSLDLPDAAIEQAPIQDASLPNGTYLYGQSSEPEQIGQEYIVFEANQGKVVGALYMPNSEFSCFSGTLDAKHLNLTVVNPYDQTAISHVIAREQPASVATTGGQLNLEHSYDSLTYPHAVGLEGYQQISEVSDNDQRILNMCRNNYQEQIWTH